MTVRSKIYDVAGKLCETVLPIRHDRYLGSGTETAICTLSTIGLLEEISGSGLMDRVAVAGRLLSENKGIDAIIQFTLTHTELRHIVLCGREVRGHKAGQALLSVHRNGIDAVGRIVGATGPRPFLKSPARDVDAFRRQVRITDMIGTADITKIIALVA